MSEYPKWIEAEDVRIQCMDCTAECCKHVAIPIDKPEDTDDWQEIADYVQYQNISVYEDNDNDWLVEFKTRCEQLDGNKCVAFKENKQPMTCREYEIDSCVMNAPGEYYEVMFDRPEQVVAYARKKGFDISMEKEKDCSNECCNHLAITIDTPEDWRDFDDIRWYVAHRDVSVYKDEDEDWLVSFYTRPIPKCKRCDRDACSTDDEDYPVLFETMQDVDVYLEREQIEPEAKEKLILTSF